MTEIDEIKELVPQFYFTVVNDINIIEDFLIEIISVDISKDAKNILNRVTIGDWLHNLGFQNKITLLRIILEINHPDILKSKKDYFTQLGHVKKYRDDIAHSPISYERDLFEKNAKLVIDKRKIDDKVKLSKKQMDGILKTVEKCKNETFDILRLVGKSKNLRF